MFHHKARHAAPRKARRKFRVLLAVPLAILAGGAAFAYFAISTGDGSFQVAQQNNFTITMGQMVGAPLAPGNGVTEDIPYSVTNNTTHSETLTSFTYNLVTNSAGDVYDTTSQQFINNCQASWFQLIGGDGGVAMPTVFPAGSTMMPNAAVYLTMPADSTDNQSACEGTTPEVQVQVS